MDADAVNLVLLAFRVLVGGVMIAHGYGHIFRGGKIEGTAGWFESLGMRPGIVHAWLASLSELGGGALLVLGLLTPLGAGAVIGVMVVAWITAHRTNGFFIFNEGQGWEYVAVLTGCGLVLATRGPGEWSLDNALDLWTPIPGRDGLLIGAVAGFGGAAGLLGTFWRPNR